MQSNNIVYSFFVISIILIVSCSSKKGSNKTETLEIYKTAGNEATMEVGALQHFESTEYNGSQKTATSYFEANGTLKGKQIYLYNDKDTMPIGSDYVDKDGKLMSYYKYINDKNGKCIAAYAFDAATNELLRVEQYYFKGNIKASERVFDGQLTPNRRYAFTYDTNENVTGFQVYNANDSLVVSEEFKITKKDAKNKWIEKWGFSNGKPTTFHKMK